MGLIQRKQMKIPRTVSYQIRLTSDDLHRIFFLRHLREDNGLVCAEGEEFVYDLPAGVEALYAIEVNLFYYKGNGQLLYQLNGSHKQYSGLPEPKSLFSFQTKENGSAWFALTDDAVYSLGENGQIETVSDVGGTCAAIFKERIFIAKDNTVYYSAPLNPHDWSVTRYGGGHVELPSHDGKFIGIVAFRDQLYLFRERGIMLLRVLGDDLNFKAIPIRFGGEKIVPDTIADCGDCILFFTERGLYSFNGGTCKLQERALLEQMHGIPAHAVAYAGRYYAQCTHCDLGSCVYCFEPQAGKGHFVFLNAQLLTAGYGVWHARNRYAYCFTGRGIPSIGEVRIVNKSTDFGLGHGERILEAVTVEGAGEYKITANSEYLVPYTVKGKAGGKLCFPTSIRGSKFILDITSSYPAEVRVKAIVLHFREVKNDD